MANLSAKKPAVVKTPKSGAKKTPSKSIKKQPCYNYDQKSSPSSALIEEMKTKYLDSTVNFLTGDANETMF